MENLLLLCCEVVDAVVTTHFGVPIWCSAAQMEFEMCIEIYVVFTHNRTDVANKSCGVDFTPQCSITLNLAIIERFQFSGVCLGVERWDGHFVGRRRCLWWYLNSSSCEKYFVVVFQRCLCQRDWIKCYLGVGGASIVYGVHNDGRLQRGGALWNVLTLVPPVVQG